MYYPLNKTDFEYLRQNLDTAELYGSDSALASLFLLQPKYDIQLCVHKNILFRQYHGGENRNGWGFPLPLKAAEKDFLHTAIGFILEESKRQKMEPGFCLCTQNQKAQIDACLAKGFSDYRMAWKTNRDDCDYIYLQENLAGLPGANYQKKRNHVSRFNRIYENQWEFKSFPECDIKDDILAVEQKWFEEKDGESQKALILEKESIAVALENHELLQLRGGVLYINGKPAAMSLASPVSDSVLDVHFEKACAEYEKDGVFSVINNQFAKICGDYFYLNREEDMGVEGLRKAKLSYKPSILLDKFYGKITK